MANFRTLFTLMCCVCFLVFVAGQEEASRTCRLLPRDRYNCVACIEYDKNCAWCSQMAFNTTRCGTKEDLVELGCTEFEFPVGHVEMDKGTMEDNMLSPRSVDIEIRPNSEEEFYVTYKQKGHHEVDLYYLMDMSQSMKDDKEKLAMLGNQLAARMQKLTKNFHLGFGTFVDKKLSPFVDPRESRQEKPCGDCAPTFGFKHNMKLNQDASKFEKQVKAARISGNLDAPEGGFDALMQALACGKDIGWRNGSRKMIVYSSDAAFHYAGDGRLAGVVTPNDATCHLAVAPSSTDGLLEYDKSLEQDYPSIGQLHQKMRHQQANIIFAVGKDVVPLYERLADALPEVSTAVGQLQADSSNIVSLIEDEYQKISQKLTLTDNLTPQSGLSIRYFTKCLGTEMNETRVCSGLKENNTVQYKVKVKASGCDKQKEFSLKIQPSGLSEHVKVNIKVLCDCDCSSEEEPNSRLCNSKGDFYCGICHCRPPSVGEHCQCDGHGKSSVELDNKCRRTKDSQICESHGICDCGQCKCAQPGGNQLISGDFCECDNYNCPRFNNTICSGPNHGTCVCSRCVCFPDWTGRVCQCPVSSDKCIASNGKVCNGVGVCACGRCKCSDPKYSGITCEVCPTCPTKCPQYEPWVLCKVHDSGPYNGTKCDELDQQPFEIIEVDELPELNITHPKPVHCQAVDKGCTFYFLYVYNETLDNATVYAKGEKECPPPVPVLAIVLGVIAGIVLIGLILLLVWKLLTLLHDRREYAKFENERLMAKWDTGQNPIFHPATTTFKNPAYGGK